jgi:hypothetical protein
VAIFKQGETGVSVAQLTRRHGFSAATYCQGAEGPFYMDAMRLPRASPPTRREPAGLNAAAGTWMIDLTGERFGRLKVVGYLGRSRRRARDGSADANAADGLSPAVSISGVWYSKLRLPHERDRGGTQSCADARDSLTVSRNAQRPFYAGGG